MRAQLRQFIFGVFALLILAVIGYGIFLIAARPPEPTCFDNIQNQNEEGPDCGGPCGIACEEKYPTPISIEPLALIATQGNTFDIILQLQNKNQFMGALSFNYTLELLDFEGNLISSKQGQSYLWPQETRLLIENSLNVPNLASVKARITETQWKKFEAKLPQFKINLAKMGAPEQGQVGFYQIDATLLNETLREYPALDINILLFNASEKLISANKTRLSNIKPTEQRFFRVVWFSPFEGRPVSARFEASLEPRFLLP